MTSAIQENEFLNDLSRCPNIRVINTKSNNEFVHMAAFEFDPDVVRDESNSPEWLEQFQDYITQLRPARELFQSVTENPPGPRIPPKITFKVELMASYEICKGIPSKITNQNRSSRSPTKRKSSD